MQSLLTLPRELRDEIIDQVLLYREPNPNISDKCTCHLLPFRDENSDLYERPKSTHFTDGDTVAHGPPPAHGLLLTNRQLRDETLQRSARVKVPYVADVVIMGDQALLPTWLAVPPSPPDRAHIIPEVIFNIRMYDAYVPSDPGDPKNIWEDSRDMLMSLLQG